MFSHYQLAIHARFGNCAVFFNYTEPIVVLNEPAEIFDTFYT